MSFRRRKIHGIERQHWHAFCAENEELIASVGLPAPVVETQERFEDLLMHGYLDHHHDPTQFSVDELDSKKLEKFRALVDRYLRRAILIPG